MRNNDNCNEKGQHLQGNVIKLIIIMAIKHFRT